MQLAEEWFDLAKNNPITAIIDDKEFQGDPKTQLLLRSYRWYQDVLGIVPGKEREQVEKHMFKIAAMLPPEYSIGEITTQSSCTSSSCPTNGMSSNASGTR